MNSFNQQKCRNFPGNIFYLQVVALFNPVERAAESSVCPLEQEDPVAPHIVALPSAGYDEIQTGG